MKKEAERDGCACSKTKLCGHCDIIIGEYEDKAYKAGIELGKKQERDRIIMNPDVIAEAHRKNEEIFGRIIGDCMQTGSPIKNVIEQAKRELIDALGDWELKSPIEFELSAIIEADTGGGFRIGIVNVGAKVKTEEIQKIRLSIGPKDDDDVLILDYRIGPTKKRNFQN